MVLCWIALPIFAILGIFSARYRKLTRDSLECMFKTVTLRKCESGLDEKIRSDISGTILKYSPRTARGFYRYYKVISWIILIIFIWATYASAIGVYNYYQYGNCNGPASTGFCVFDPTGKYTGVSKLDGSGGTRVACPSVSVDDPIIGPANAKLTVIEFGCYVCPYTKEAEPVIREVIDYYNGSVNFQFKTIHLPNHKYSYEAAESADCANAQGRYSEYRDMLFASQSNLTNGTFDSIANSLELNMTKFDFCIANQTYIDKIDSDTLEGLDSGVVGTPTFFVNNQSIVGPKPFKTFKNVIDAELAKIGGK